MNNSKHISICGIGPGNPDYIVKAVYNQVEKADLLIGGIRQLDIFSASGKQSYIFDGKTANLKKAIEECNGKHIVVLVSGDTGFYSLRKFLCKTFTDTSITVTPGISTFQYFYAQLGLGYENAFLASMHGVEANFIEKLSNYSSVFLLTDRKNNYKAIAGNLVESGFGDNIMHIGINLSYPDEQIITAKASECVVFNNDYSLCSVIIENPDFE